MGNVLITGGTSGIGYALARVFAANNYNIIIVSSNDARLKRTQKKLQEEFPITVTIFEQDLSQLKAAERLYNKVQAANIDVDIFVNNAGYGLVGPTEQIGFDDDEKMMILNVLSLVELCKLFLPTMYKKQRGSILNIASTGAFQPGPFTSTYFASKAFVLSYSRAVRFEAQEHGVHVCTLCPGATKTNFFTREGTPLPKSSMSAEQVAEYAYRQLMKNKSVVIPGFINRALQVLPTYIKMVGIAKMKKD
ncbi:SDR family oxidoreductase [Sporolactobacillus shoreicorticis]|uniref:SDR family NAD(P)-dependent oxidoreductase n=1 Tax=Sporolactobacillus shoreicorticis TaxID=1923877 RepID=A0ABW5S048_9BACL|nr:SDR family oxidoreductase [Sporolactobacillus shoreicorticis]MCO7127263.1 SDR family oxidoreductase [Sporolactobacillus shoreicorticis]